MPSDANDCVSMLINVTFSAKSLFERDKSVNELRFNKMKCIFVLMSSRQALLIIYFLVMNSKRCVTQGAQCSLVKVSAIGMFGIRASVPIDSDIATQHP